MRTEQAAELLARTGLFGELDEAARRRLSEVAIDRTYKKGQLIFYQGDLGESLFIVAEGTVKVFVTSEDGDEMVLVTLGPGDIFGELAVIDGGPRSASAETLEPTKLLALTRNTLLQVMTEHPSITDSLLKTLGSVVRRLTEQASDLVFLDLHGRVAKLLVGFADARGARSDGETVLDLHLTQTDLAAMVGGSRQSVNQILRMFERRGFLELRGRKIVVKEVSQLRRRAGM
jgi:CRP/FNR family cyclic AMP-dependent transcriptional regulator